MTTLPHVCAFIPPHVLHHVACSGERDAASDARATLDQMHTVVADRGRSLLPPVPPARRRGRQRNVYDARNQWSLPGRLIISEHRTRSTDIEAPIPRPTPVPAHLLLACGRAGPRSVPLPHYRVRAS